MTNKEKAIRKFSKAMRTAYINYVARQVIDVPDCMTMNMRAAWVEYILACREEFQHGRS
jgi:hypothetical protein